MEPLGLHPGGFISREGRPEEAHTPTPQLLRCPSCLGLCRQKAFTFDLARPEPGAKAYLFSLQTYPVCGIHLLAVETRLAENPNFYKQIIT